MKTLIRLFNTLGWNKQAFKPVKPGRVGIYTCGPTVYSYAHIGHARAYVFADTLRRMFLYNGYRVKQVMNITDVGHLSEADLSDEGVDKIEAAAKKERKTVWDVADFYTKDFFAMLEALNILSPSVVCKATDYIKEQIELIKKLEKNGFVYVIDRGVCFDTAKFPHYTELAKLNPEGMREGARIESDRQKKNPTDFWLWRFSDPSQKRQMEWSSPWGKGFPGWHVECSAMSMKHLGERFDIHTGGVDHIPVHHTNEIAQNQAAVGHRVVNYWLHNNFLQVEGEKMGKSCDNFYRVKDVEKRGFDPLALRYLFLTAHHRSEINFTWEALKGAQAALDNLRDYVVDWRSGVGKGRKDQKRTDEYKKEFLKNINDDLGTARALALAWEVAKSDLSERNKLKLIIDFDRVFGLGLKGWRVEAPEEIKRLVGRREKLRKEKKFAQADKIRNQLERLGWRVEEGREEAKIKRIKE